MGLRKKVALVFILLANIILLAHAAIPHHHHDLQVCIDHKLCEDHRTPHTHSPLEHDHQHNGNDSSDCCILKQLVLLPSNQDKQECKCSFLTDGHSSDDGFQAVLFDNEFLSFRSIVALNTDVPLRTPPYIVFVNNSLGLRAPPTV